MVGDFLYMLQNFEVDSSLAQDFKIEYTNATNQYSYAMSLKTYNRIRYLVHLSRIRPSFARKIRKCHMRKAVQRYQHEKKRAQGRYGI